MRRIASRLLGTPQRLVALLSAPCALSLMTDPNFDCVVIGSGPGGYVAAIRAAQVGMRTAIIEADRVGGRCLNYACIPAKAVLRAADVLSEIRGSAAFGIEAPDPTVNFGGIQQRREDVIGTLTGGVSALLKKNDVTVISGRAKMISPKLVDVNGQLIPATRAVILATGSTKRPLPGASFEGRVIGTEEAWALSELPRSMAVVGAGASGTEIASAYTRLGTRVMLFEGLDRVLPSEDPDVSKVAARSFTKQGIKVHTSTFVEDIETDEHNVRFRHGDQHAEVDWLVIATGRAPDREGLGLDELGVITTDAGLIEVDARMRTNLPELWAIGDLTPGPALAHKASDEGVIAAEDAAGLHSHPLTYVDIPRATFCSPNVASFGLTEPQAAEAGRALSIGKVSYGAVGAGTVYGDRTGIIKIVSDKESGEILGGHIVGAKATELIQELVIAKAAELGVPELARIPHGHPTLSEGVMEAARAADGWLIHG